MRSVKWWVVILVVLSLVLSACGQASSNAAATHAAEQLSTYAESSNRFALKLPPLYVQYDNKGVLSIAGITTVQLYNWTGIDLRGLNLRPDVVATMVNADIQHIEIAEDANGLAVYVNGKPLPYIAWDEESLRNLGDLLPALQVPHGKVIRALLPLVRYTQLALVVQFPIKPGATMAPFRPRNAPAVVTARARSLQEPVAIVRLDVAYDEQGMPSVLGLDANLLALLGIDVKPLALNPSLVQTFMKANIQHVHFVNRPDGVHIYVNNKPLPYIAWDDEHVQTAIDVFARFSGLKGTPFMNLLTQVLPGMRASDIDLLLRFPVPEGQEPIPVLEAPAP